MKVINSVQTGRCIKEVMNSRRITVRECASKLHVTEQSVYHWRSGRSLPSLEVFVNLGDYVGVSFERMLVYEERGDQ